jgi:Flp pilus assembly protein TadG
MTGLIERFLRDTRGLVFAEAAVSLSVLSVTLLGGLEMGRYVLLTQKLDRVAATVADVAAQGQTISVADIDNLFAAANDILKPFSLGPAGAVIVSSVSATGANPAKVDWQREGGGTLDVSSAIGSSGNTATMPPDFTVRPGEEVIVGEVYYNFTPWLAPDVVATRQLYHRAFYRPRQGPLTTLQP